MTATRPLSARAKTVRDESRRDLSEALRLVGKCGQLYAKGLKICVATLGHVDRHHRCIMYWVRQAECARDYERTPARRAQKARYERTPARRARQVERNRSPAVNARKAKWARTKYKNDPEYRTQMLERRGLWRNTTLTGSVYHLTRHMEPEEKQVFLVDLEAAYNQIDKLPETTQEYLELLERIVTKCVN